MPVRHDHHVLPLGAEVVDFHHVVLHDKKKTHKFLGLHDSFWLLFVTNISANQAAPIPGVPSSPSWLLVGGLALYYYND